MLCCFQQPAPFSSHHLSAAIPNTSLWNLCTPQRNSDHHSVTSTFSLPEFSHYPVLVTWNGKEGYPAFCGNSSRDLYVCKQNSTSHGMKTRQNRCWKNDLSVFSYKIIVYIYKFRRNEKSKILHFRRENITDCCCSLV